MRRLALCLLGLAAVAQASAWGSVGSGWTPQVYPNPTTNPEACGRLVQSWVCDPDYVLSVNSRDVVEGIIKSIAQGNKPFATRPCGTAGEVGPQVAVALMKSFDARLVHGQYPEDVAASFAYKLHERWGVGHQQCSDGVLLLLSVDDRQVYISRGAGAAVYLTDHVIDNIINAMKPQLRSRRYEEAIEQAVLDIGRALAAPAPPKQSPVLGWLLFAAILTGFGALVWFLISKGRTEQSAFNACKAKLDKLRRDQAALRGGQTYNPTSCPICLEDFEPTEPDPAAAAAASAASQAAAGDPEASASDEFVDGRPPGSPSPSLEPLLGLQRRVQAMSGRDGGVGSSSGGGVPAPAPAAASAPPAPAAAGAGAAPVRNRKPLILPCKHQFCEPCITEWVGMRKLNCPVCRKPIDEGPGDSRSPPPPRPPCQEGFEEQQHQDTFRRAYQGPYRGYYDPRYRHRGYNRQDLLRDELLFRLAMMRRRYPQYIDDHMVNQWSDDLAAGREVNPGAWHSFELRNPAVRAQLAQSGSHGSSSGFGGGRANGGGRGGSW